ncbi:MAG: hypothetical protein Q9M40_07070 [Sulfurimonas sp.]|nr:hypothetical protein [Sulfurimonas sp.]MDQ7067735.1 hypothetical protein [Sulfurimonas sp.]
MAITVKRKNREIRDTGTISAVVGVANIGQTLDFMGIPEGFRVVDVNVTVDTAFDNADNTISIGIESDVSRFTAVTAMNAVKGIAFNNRQLSAVDSTAIVADIKGTASINGSATVTVSYVKLPVSKQEY